MLMYFSNFHRCYKISNWTILRTCFFLVFNSWKVFIFLNIQNLNGKLGVDFMIRKLFS